VSKKPIKTVTTLVDKLHTVTTEEELSNLYATLPEDAVILKEELVHMMVHVMQLHAKNTELINQLASQQSHVESMERQIIETSNITKPEPSEIDELSMLIERALREEAQVYVSVNTVRSESHKFTFGGDLT